MKKEETPQDFSKLGTKNIKELCYVTDENGNYITTQSSGWEPKTIALDKAWEYIHQTAEQVRQEVLNGKVSPLAYYMELRAMDTQLLSDVSGIWHWRVKRHMKPSIFKRLSNSILKRYANALEIEVEQLTHFK